MNNDKKKVDVVDWQDIPPLIVARAGSPSRYFSLVPTGIIGALLIHDLIVPSAYFGSYGIKVRPFEIQVPSAIAKAESDSRERLALITLGTECADAIREAV